MITVNHVLSSRIHPSQIFDDLYRRLDTLAPDDFALSKTFVADPKAMIRHYHRPHREWRLRGPSVVTIHHDPLDTYPFLAANFFLPKWRLATKIICLNSHQKQFLEQHNINQSVIIPHGVDRDVFPIPKTPRELTGNKIVLGFVSKHYARGIKGEASLLKLIESLDPKLFSFIFLGEGRWQVALKALQRGYEVEHYEYLPYHLYGEVYAKMNALLILSEFEGGPASLPEAIGSGLPVISRPVGMVTDWIIHNENGLILHENDWIEQIVDLAQNHSLLRTLNQGAFEASRYYPSWEQTLAQQFVLYRQLLA